MTTPTIEQVEEIKRLLVGYWAAHQHTFDGSGGAMVCDAYVKQDEIHWKTRRTLLRQVSTLEAENARLKQQIGENTWRTSFWKKWNS